jgi:hypothetical protein
MMGAVVLVGLVVDNAAGATVGASVFVDLGVGGRVGGCVGAAVANDLLAVATDVAVTVGWAIVGDAGALGRIAVADGATIGVDTSARVEVASSAMVGNARFTGLVGAGVTAMGEALLV